MPVFGTLDWLVVGAYFALLLAVAIRVVRKKSESATDYFLAGRHVGWFVIGASIFASNIGSEHIVGLAGTGMKSGVVMGHYELHSWLVLLLGWVFVPFYMRSRVFTMPEFLERRYDGSARWLLSLTALVGYVLTKISVTIFAGAIVCETLLEIPFWAGAGVVVVLTGLYTLLGGLRAVVYTEALQAIVLLLGSITVTVFGMMEIGGWSELREAAGPDAFNMFLPADHPEFPWTGMVFAPPIVGLWYWCTDQYIVQRALAGKDERTARRGTIFAAYLKLLPFFLFLFPGIIAGVLVRSGRLEIADADQAFPTLVATLLPAGIRGLVAGGLIAALMSSLAAVFNSSSTLFTMDVYKKLRPEAPEKRLVGVGRIATGVLVLLGIAWIPVLEKISGELYHYLQSVQAYIAPPIAAVFLLGVFSKRINARGALVALVGGFLVGMARLVAELNKESLDGALLTFAEINFLHFAILLFAISCSLLVIGSLTSPPPSAEQLDGLDLRHDGGPGPRTLPRELERGGRRLVGDRGRDPDRDPGRVLAAGDRVVGGPSIPPVERGVLRLGHPHEGQAKEAVLMAHGHRCASDLLADSNVDVVRPGPGELHGERQAVLRRPELVGISPVHPDELGGRTRIARLDDLPLHRDQGGSLQRQEDLWTLPRVHVHLEKRGRRSKKRDTGLHRRGRHPPWAGDEIRSLEAPARVDPEAEGSLIRFELHVGIRRRPASAVDHTARDPSALSKPQLDLAPCSLLDVASRTRSVSVGRRAQEPGSVARDDDLEAAAGVREAPVHQRAGDGAPAGIEDSPKQTRQRFRNRDHANALSSWKFYEKLVRFDSSGLQRQTPCSRVKPQPSSVDGRVVRRIATTSTPAPITDHSRMNVGENGAPKLVDDIDPELAQGLQDDLEGARSRPHSRPRPEPGDTVDVASMDHEFVFGVLDRRDFEDAELVSSRPPSQEA